MFAALLASLALAQSTPLEDPAETFGTLPLLRGLDISPDGKKGAALIRANGEQGLGIFSIENGFEYKHFIRDKDEKKLREFFWKQDDLVVFSVSLPGRRYGTRTTETRLFSMEVESGEMRGLFSRAHDRNEMPPQIQDNVVSLLPKDPDNILVEFREPASPYDSVHRLNVAKIRRPVTVQRSVNQSVGFLADPAGTVRYSSGIRNDTERRLALLKPDDKWQDFSHRIREGQPTFRVIGFPNDRKYAYVLSDFETETRALYRFNIENDQFEELLFKHPTSDVLGIRQNPDTGEVIGAVYAEDERYVSWFGDSKPKRTVDALTQATDYPNLAFVRYNLSQSAAVLFSSSGSKPGRYIIFDYETGGYIEMPSQYPGLANVELGKVIATSYKARDGLEIPAFVTLPPGYGELSELDNVPFVILPHGGPTARDYSGFDWLAQFLAHKGYGVLQMNFRGSAGYGAEFVNAGDRQWGQAMQDDITDGTQWLIKNGYADAGKTSILGASYGGYAALMGAVREPDLFRCAVSINGVTDLPKVISDARDYVGGRLGTRHIGRLWQDRGMLRENSPIEQVDEIEIPVLLIAGESDRVVPREHSTTMERRMKRKGKDVELVMLKDGSHYLDVNDNRVIALRAIDEFLEGCR